MLFSPKWISCLLVLMLLMAGCGTPTALDDNALDDNALEFNDEYLYIFTDQHRSSNIEQIIANSQVIAIGVFGEESGEINAARTASNPAEHHPEIVMMTKLYPFKVETYLRGSEKDEITLGMSYSIGTKKNPYLQYEPDFFDPIPGQRVLVFLNKGGLGEWYPASQPFAFSINENELNIISPVPQTLADFSESITLENLLSLLKSSD